MPTSYTVDVPAWLLQAGPWLLASFAGFLLGMVLAWFLNRAALKPAWSFLAESARDPRGRADGKLLTLAAMAVCVVAIVANGLITHYWPPEYIWYGLLFFLSAGYGFSMYENRAQIITKGNIRQAELTGQPAPGPPAPAPTMKTETITTVE